MAVSADALQVPRSLSVCRATASPPGSRSRPRKQTGGGLIKAEIIYSAVLRVCCAVLHSLQHCMLTGPDCGARAMVDCSQFAGIFEGFGCCSNRDDVDRTVSLCNPPGVSKTDQQAPQTRCGVGITFRASSGGLKVYRSSSTLAFFALQV